MRVDWSTSASSQQIGGPGERIFQTNVPNKSSMAADLREVLLKASLREKRQKFWKGVDFMSRLNSESYRN